MRLRIRDDAGAVMDAVTPSTEFTEEPITMTPDQIIFSRRVQVLAHAKDTANVAATCRTFGISRTTYYRWAARAGVYGLEALMPKGRREPQMPNATPTWVVEQLLAEAVVRATLGCRPLADWMAERGFVVSKTTVQAILVRHGLGTRRQRLEALATLTAARTGLVVPMAGPELMGFCHWAAGPGELMALDSFYIGNLKGVGPVYQLTAVDTATRWALVWIVVGTVTAARAAEFVDRITKSWQRLGFGINGVLTDNGPEYVGRAFRDHLHCLGIDHRRIPARSPNHNAVCERFQGTMLQECWRPAFHRRRFNGRRELQAEADAWLVHYNTRRHNHGDFMAGRRPVEVLDNHRRNTAA